jgi:hypothetical protein
MRPLRLILALGLLTLPACGGSDPEPPPDPRDRVEAHVNRYAAGLPDASGWYEAVSKQGGFAIRFPGPFTDFDLAMEDTTGKPVRLHGVGMTNSAGYKFSTSAMRRADGQPVDETVFTEMVADLKKEGGLKSQAEATVAGQKGTEIVADDGEHITRMRAVMIGPALYQLAVEYTPNSAAAVEPLAQKFFDSFRLQPPAEK